MTELLFRLPDEVDKVPTNKVGIYSFSVALASDYALGLGATGEDLSRVKRELELRICRYSMALNSVGFSGRLASDAFAKHLRHRWEVNGQWSDTSNLSGLLAAYFEQSGTSGESLRILTAILRNAISLAPPLYVGMTAEQSFRSRLDQHLSYQTGFSESVRHGPIHWGDLLFRCIPMESVSRTSVVSVERIVQALLKPRYSKG